MQVGAGGRGLLLELGLVLEEGALAERLHLRARVVLRHQRCRCERRDAPPAACADRRTWPRTCCSRRRCSAPETVSSTIIAERRRTGLEQGSVGVILKLQRFFGAPPRKRALASIVEPARRKSSASPSRSSRPWALNRSAATSQSVRLAIARCRAETASGAEGSRSGRRVSGRASAAVERTDSDGRAADGRAHVDLHRGRAGVVRPAVGASGAIGRASRRWSGGASGCARRAWTAIGDECASNTPPRHSPARAIGLCRARCGAEMSTE